MCGICSLRRKLPHVCFAVSAGVLKVRLDTKVPKKFSFIYIYIYVSCKLTPCTLLICSCNPVVESPFVLGSALHMLLSTETYENKMPYAQGLGCESAAYAVTSLASRTGHSLTQMRAAIAVCTRRARDLPLRAVYTATMHHGPMACGRFCALSGLTTCGSSSQQ